MKFTTKYFIIPLTFSAGVAVGSLATYTTMIYRDSSTTEEFVDRLIITKENAARTAEEYHEAILGNDGVIDKTRETVNDLQKKLEEK